MNEVNDALRNSRCEENIVTVDFDWPKEKVGNANAQDNEEA